MNSSNPGFRDQSRILEFNWVEDRETVVIVMKNQLWGWAYPQWNSVNYYQSSLNGTFNGIYPFGGGNYPRIDHKWSYSQLFFAETFLKFQLSSRPLSVQSFKEKPAVFIPIENWRVDYKGNLSALAWDRNADLLLMGTDTGIIYQWNDDFTVFTEMASGFGSIHSMTVSPDNQLLAIELQNKEDYELVIVDRNNYSNLTSVSLKTNLKYLQWTEQANQQQLVYHENNSSEISIVGQDLIDQDIWDYGSIDHNNNLLAVSFSNSNNAYLTLDDGSIIQYTNVQDNKFEISMSYSPDSQATALAISPDGTMFVHNEGQSLIIRDMDSFDVIYRIDDEDIEVNHVDYMEIEIAFPLIATVLLLPLLTYDRVKHLRTRQLLKNTNKYDKTATKANLLYPKENN